VEEKSSEEIKRAVLNRDAMVYPALRDLTEGGYLDCRSEAEAERPQHACQLTEKGKEAYVASARAWQQVR
jgi:DNA-binding PadR family transcriptional regulator